MIKAIPVDGYKLGEPAVSLVRQSSRGLIGHDRSEFLKRASAEFVNQFDNVRLQPGESPSAATPARARPPARAQP
jgi:hypothetical protein